MHLKKLRRAEGGAKIVGAFRVKNHDFTPKNHIFSNFRGGVRRVRAPPPESAPVAEHKARFVACRDSSNPSGLASTTAHLIFLRSTASTKSTFLGGLISIELSINHLQGLDKIQNKSKQVNESIAHSNTLSPTGRKNQRT